MTVPIEPASSARLRLTLGIDVLENWSRDANDLARTAVYEVLFSVTERSVFKDHVVVDVADRPTEFFVLARRDLAVKIRLHSLDACEVVYIGPAGTASWPDGGCSEAAPGQDLATRSTVAMAPGPTVA